MLTKFPKYLLFIVLLFVSLNGFSEEVNPVMHDLDSTTHDFTYGDFNGDDREDLLFVANAPGGQSGIALSDDTGEFTVIHQLWDSNHLGLSWHDGNYIIHVADFNGDGRADVFMDHKNNGSNYVLLGDTSGKLVALSHTIDNTEIDLDWGSSRLEFGDFNSDGRTDVYLQPKSTSTSNHVVFATTTGDFTTIGDTWGNEHLGLKWSQKDSLVYAIDNLLLVLSKPDYVMVPYKEYKIPVVRSKFQKFDFVEANDVGKFSEGKIVNFKPGGGHCRRVPQLCSSR